MTFKRQPIKPYGPFVHFGLEVELDAERRTTCLALFCALCIRKRFGVNADTVSAGSGNDRQRWGEMAWNQKESMGGTIKGILPVCCP